MITETDIANDPEMVRLRAAHSDACATAHREYDRIDALARLAAKAAERGVWQHAADNDEPYRSSVTARTAAQDALNARFTELTTADD